MGDLRRRLAVLHATFDGQDYFKKNNATNPTSRTVIQIHRKRLFSGRSPGFPVASKILYTSLFAIHLAIMSSSYFLYRCS